MRWKRSSAKSQNSDARREENPLCADRPMAVARCQSNYAAATTLAATGRRLLSAFWAVEINLPARQTHWTVSLDWRAAPHCGVWRRRDAVGETWLRPPPPRCCSWFSCSWSHSLTTDIVHNHNACASHDFSRDVTNISISVKSTKLYFTRYCSST